MEQSTVRAKYSSIVFTYHVDFDCTMNGTAELVLLLRTKCSSSSEQLRTDKQIVATVLCTQSYPVDPYPCRR